MGTSVTGYSVSLTLDAKDYIDKSKISRQETAELTRSINSARNPAEKYSRSVETLDRALEKGAISQRTYNRLVEEAKGKLETTTKASDSFKESLLGYAAAYAGIAGIQKGLSIVRDRMQEIDNVTKSARGIGENVNQLQRFTFAVSELGGIDGQTAITMLTKLNQRVGEAASGMGEAGQYFEDLGLNIEELSQMSPVAQFEALSGAISNLENPAQQAAYATKFFEEQGSKLLPVLTASREEYEASAGQVNALGLAISELDAANIEATNDALGRLAGSISGIAQQVGSIPGVSTAFNLLAKSISAAGAASELLNFNVLGGDAEKMKSIMDRMGFDTPDFKPEKVIGPIKEITSQAEKQKSLADEIAKKKKIEAEASKKATEDAKEKARIDKEAADAAKRAAEDESRRRSDALASARKHFDEERKRQMKMREDVESKFKSVEVGSADDVRMQAESINRMQTAGMVQNQPTDEMLLTEAKKQYEETVKQTKIQEAQEKKLEAMLTELKNPKIKAFR